MARGFSGQERDRLIAASALDSDVVVECDAETIEFLAGGPNAQSETAFTWEMHEDDRYTITGQSGLLERTPMVFWMESSEMMK